MRACKFRLGIFGFRSDRSQDLSGLRITGLIGLVAATLNKTLSEVVSDQVGCECILYGVRKTVGGLVRFNGSGRVNVVVDGRVMSESNARSSKANPKREKRRMGKKASRDAMPIVWGRRSGKSSKQSRTGRGEIFPSLCPRE